MLAFVAMSFLLLNLFRGSVAEAEFHMVLKGGLHPNTLLTASIEIPENTPRFGFNFMQDATNILFHFDARFNYGKTFYTVCNHMENDNWGTELETFTDFPFKIGGKYQIDILCLPNSYEVYVNGKYYLKYESPMKPLERVKYIEAWGSKIEYIHVRPMQS
ncbi:galectin-3-like [Lissotriton helveticus]